MIKKSIRSQNLDGLYLDGTWKIKQDPGGVSAWCGADSFPMDALDIRVPGNIWEVPDYIGYNDYVWYSRTFIPEMTLTSNMNYYLRFGAVQYYSDVYLNGFWMGSHEGADTPFEFDATSHLLQGLNRLTVRVKNPKALGKDPVTFDMGGITQHVTLAAQPVVRIKDVFVKPDILGWAKSHSVVITLIITLENNTSTRADVNLQVSISEPGSNMRKEDYFTNGVVDGHTTTYAMEINVSDCKLWSVDHPNLYLIQVTMSWVSAEGAETRQDDYTFRTGFRDLRISGDGYFQLNGERIYIKSLHDSVYDPVITQNTRDYSKFRNILVALKAAGFNTYRLLNYAPLPEHLDIADELGMIIYAEHQGSWNFKTTMDPAKFTLSIIDVLKAYRNHPSLGIWGLLNESNVAAYTDAARDFLILLREIDDTRLVFLNSSRFDMKFPEIDPSRANAKIASASNPGSSTWDVYLGGEDPVNPITTDTVTDIANSWCYISGAGDSHLYPAWPFTPLFYKEMSVLARTTKPVFISEGGVGNSYNPIGEQLKLQQAGVDPNSWEYASHLNKMAEGLKRVWKKYNLYNEYPIIEDFSIDSYRQQSRHREMMFNIYRSNPKIMSYSLTSCRDAGCYAEGIFDAFGEFKPGIMDVLQAGWSKLKWNLFMNPGAENTYSDQSFYVKISLANENVLPVLPLGGYYPITLCIAGKGGAVWTKEITNFNVSGNLADTVHEGTITADQFYPLLTEGTYTLSATMSSGGHPSSNKMSFYVTEKKNHKDFSGRKVTVLGVGHKISSLLTDRNASVFPYNPLAAFDNEVIVVGDQTNARTVLNSVTAWRELYQKVANGAHVVFLDSNLLSDGSLAEYDGAPDNFGDKNTNNKWIPLASGKGTQRYNEKIADGDWLYHKEFIAKNSCVFDGMLGTGLMDPEYYSGIFRNAKYFSGIAVPDDTSAVALFVNMETVFEGVVIGTYNFHGGKITINSFSITKHVGTPAADRLLVNMAYMASLDAELFHPVAIRDTDWDSLGIS